jgi:toxin YoeB
MNIIFTPEAWAEYKEWGKLDKKVQGKIDRLIESIFRDGFLKGIGQPEVLKYRKEFSRRITHVDRLIYTGDEKQILVITSCTGQSED